MQVHAAFPHHVLIYLDILLKISRYVYYLLITFRFEICPGDEFAYLYRLVIEKFNQTYRGMQICYSELLHFHHIKSHLKFRFDVSCYNLDIVHHVFSILTHAP